jgi:hypothetical protein
MNRSGMFHAFFVQFLLCFTSENAKTTAGGGPWFLLGLQEYLFMKNYFIFLKI